MALLKENLNKDLNKDPESTNTARRIFSGENQKTLQSIFNYWKQIQYRNEFRDNFFNEVTPEVSKYAAYDSSVRLDPENSEESVKLFAEGNADEQDKENWNPGFLLSQGKTLPPGNTLLELAKAEDPLSSLDAALRHRTTHRCAEPIFETLNSRPIGVA